MYTSSLSWQSPDYQRTRVARRNSHEFRSRVLPTLPETYGFVLRDEEGNVERNSHRQIKRNKRILPFSLPLNPEQYQEHVEDLGRLRLARARSRQMSFERVPVIPPFQGEDFRERTRGTVLCHRTIWCPAYHNPANQRVGSNTWPDKDVRIFEGDKREYPNVGCYSRYLPLVRDLSSRPEGTEYSSDLLEDPVLLPSAFDTVWTRPSTQPKDEVPTAEVPFGHEAHLLNSDLRWELDYQDDERLLARP